MATLTINMDDTLKEEFATFCKTAGLNASVAVNMFATTVVRQQRIPFIISTAEVDLNREQLLRKNIESGHAAIRAGNYFDADETEAEIRALRGW
ncbi:MAG: type II toxin-antitoxin system RelB/DinJ family antitoxin [Raoultibacter sp.]